MTKQTDQYKATPCTKRKREKNYAVLVCYSYVFCCVLVNPGSFQPGVSGINLPNSVPRSTHKYQSCPELLPTPELRN